MTIAERMGSALAALNSRHGGKRHPKAFYLNEDDWSEFIRTDPPSVDVWWGNNPPIHRRDPAFRGVPVRPSTSARSRLYDNTGGGAAYLD